jgi:drug/metabolite transporter (DMT)-like permease
MKLFKSVILTGLFFGIISGIMEVMCITLPTHHELKDILMLLVALVSIILSQVYVDITNTKEPFYRIFFSSCIAFICFPISLELYFKMKQNPIETEWLTLLCLGTITCFITAVFTSHFRSKKNLLNN